MTGSIAQRVNKAQGPISCDPGRMDDWPVTIMCPECKCSTRVPSESVLSFECTTWGCRTVFEIDYPVRGNSEVAGHVVLH